MNAMKLPRVAVFLMVLAVSSLAQDFQPLPAPPDVVGVPFYLDSSAGALKKLPAEPYKEHDGRGPFTLNAPQTVQMQGAASAFRIPGHNKIVFVFDATNIPKLYKFSVHGKKREFEYAKVGTRSSTPNDGLPINVSRYKGTAYQLSTDQPLTAGEYAIVLGNQIYSFGVDDKN